MFASLKENRSLFCYIIFFLLVFTPSIIISKEKNDTLKFTHLTDVHLILNPISYDSTFVHRRYNYFWDSYKPFKNFLTTNPIVKKSDFLVITGDMVDYFEAESKEGGLMGNQIELFQSFINSSTNSLIYYTLGNHDITSYPKGSYNQNSAYRARATWIKNIPSFYQGTYYSKNYKVGKTNYRLIFLDNAYFSERKSKDEADFIVDQPQLDWLKAQLNESQDDKEIIFMHMPLPTPEKYNEMSKDQFIDYVSYVEETKTKNLLDVIKDATNDSVQLFVTGHNHENEFFNFKFSDDFNFYQVKTGSFGNSVDNWRFFQLTESEIIISNPESTNNTIILPLK